MNVLYAIQTCVFPIVSSPEADRESWLKKKLRRLIAPITFSETDLEGTSQTHDDALVVTCRIGGSLVKKVMVDQRTRPKLCTTTFIKG